jgi:hypothetical protein
MPTEIYKSGIVETMNGDKLYITPLKIKYMRQFMETFKDLENTSGDAEAIDVLARCCLVSMQQYYPSIKTIEDLEDSFDMNAIYEIIDLGAGIKVRKTDSDDVAESIKEKAKKDGGTTWDTLDLAKLESEAFLLGIWKDYEDLETSLSMSELTAILESKRESDYADKRFLAAIQGVDLDAQSGKKEEDPWEAMKARVAAKVSGIESSGSNDITSFTGIKAQKAGFGIGIGLGYEKITE